MAGLDRPSPRNRPDGQGQVIEAYLICSDRLRLWGKRRKNEASAWGQAEASTKWRRLGSGRHLFP
jgi:hypothetical protein